MDHLLPSSPVYRPASGFCGPVPGFSPMRGAVSCRSLQPDDGREGLSRDPCRRIRRSEGHAERSCPGRLPDRRKPDRGRHLSSRGAGRGSFICRGRCIFRSGRPGDPGAYPHRGPARAVRPDVPSGRRPAGRAIHTDSLTPSRYAYKAPAATVTIRLADHEHRPAARFPCSHRGGQGFGSPQLHLW